MVMIMKPVAEHVRDYIHIMDLAEGHVSALEFKNIEQNFQYLNFGIWQGLFCF